MRRKTGRPKKRRRVRRQSADTRKIAGRWSALLDSCASVFGCPSLPLFVQLTSTWALCSGRHTVTRMIETIEFGRRRSQDAYHRFLRTGSWILFELWAVLARQLVAALVPWGVIPLNLDDTLLHKSGRRIDGAGIFRDAVRSTASPVVHAWGLNLVVLGLRVTPPRGGEPLTLPINVRVHRKGGPTLIDLAEEMMREVAGFPSAASRCVPTAPTPPWPVVTCPARSSPPVCVGMQHSSNHPRRAAPTTAVAPQRKAAACPLPTERSSGAEGFASFPWCLRAASPASSRTATYEASPSPTPR